MFTFVVFFVLYYAMFSENPTTMLISAYSILATSVAIVTGIMMTNYRAYDSKTIPQYIIVKAYLDDYFEKVN